MNPSTAFTATLVDELARCGLAEAVLAPGSRSAPLAMALWDQAARHPGGLRLHVRIDERSASFLALGLAKASRRPVALVCTSGTAAAHFHAAVIEASEAGVPLLVLTADRPPELRGTGANQTIDQLKLYGDAVRWFCEVGVPEARLGMNAYWRSLACRAWAAAAGAGGGYPGPVHLNLPLRDPLVPGAPDPGTETGTGADGWPESLAGRAGGEPWTAVFGATVLDEADDAARGAGGGPAKGRGRHVHARPGAASSPRSPVRRWSCRGPSGGSSSVVTAAPIRRRCSSSPRRPAGRSSPSPRRARGRGR